VTGSEKSLEQASLCPFEKRRNHEQRTTRMRISRN
jgi:hypothetical protein